jgi:hypothetical protein
MHKIGGAHRSTQEATGEGALRRNGYMDQSGCASARPCPPVVTYIVCDSEDGLGIGSREVRKRRGFRAMPESPLIGRLGLLDTWRVHGYFMGRTSTCMNP